MKWMNGWCFLPSPQLEKAVCGRHLGKVRIVLISNNKGWYELCFRHLTRALSELAHLILTAILWGWLHYYQPHCTAGETEGQKSFRLLIQHHTASTGRQGCDPRAFTFAYETYCFLCSSDFGNRTLTMGTDLTPWWYQDTCGLKKKKKKAAQWSSLLGEKGLSILEKWAEETPRRTGGHVSRSPQPSRICVSLWMRYIPSEFHVLICVEVSLWSSQPS